MIRKGVDCIWTNVLSYVVLVGATQAYFLRKAKQLKGQFTPESNIYTYIYDMCGMFLKSLTCLFKMKMYFVQLIDLFHFLQTGCVSFSFPVPALVIGSFCILCGSMRFVSASGPSSKHNKQKLGGKIKMSTASLRRLSDSWIRECNGVVLSLMAGDLQGSQWCYLVTKLVPCSVGSEPTEVFVRSGGAGRNFQM